MARRGNKYNARRTTIEGITFDSKREAARYLDLKMLDRAGEIWNLELQPVYKIEINGKKVGHMTLDFRYDTPDGKVVEDVKSKITRKGEAYRLRKRIIEALHDIEIVEVL